MWRLIKNTLLFILTLNFTYFLYGQTADITGELKTWHKVTITFNGPTVSELDTPNPFTDYLLNVTFTNGSSVYITPGYFAADGNANNTSASSGNKWRVHFNPPLKGTWNYTVSFRTGTNIATGDNPTAGTAISPLNGQTGSFLVTDTDKSGQDFRGQGWLEHNNEHYFKYKGSGGYRLQTGSNSPENFLGFWEFDNTQDYGGWVQNLPDGLHHYGPHVNDWTASDPTWKNGKGKGIIGAINYLSSEEVNVLCFLVMNVNGDDRDVYPWTSYYERKRFDVSKLAQWEIVFEHMQKKGILLHIMLQEFENDTLLNSGNLGLERKIYYRELIARFAHHNALYWNLGEETSRTTAQIKGDAAFFKKIDPYKHPVKVHSKFDAVLVENLYTPLLGDVNYDATAFQAAHVDGHPLPLKWRSRSAQAGFKWVIEHDEIGGIGTDIADNNKYENYRRNALWGNLMGGGGGVEWDFITDRSATTDDHDCEDFRTRNLLWDYGRFAVNFFHTNLDFTKMESKDAIITNNNYNWVLYNPAIKQYAVYLSYGGATITLPAGNWVVRWYNPRTGGSLSAPTDLIAGKLVAANSQDWVALITPKSQINQPPVVKLTAPSTGVEYFTSTNITISADANDPDGTITKVRFYANNTLLVEDVTYPYSYVWKTNNPGTYSITAEATDNTGEIVTDSKNITLSMPTKTLTGLTLVNTTNGLPVTGFDPIVNGATINLSNTGNSINIKANTNTSQIGSIKFILDDIAYRTETTAPYALAGDNAGKYLNWNATLGNHRLLVQAYGGPNATGTILDTLSVNFSVTNVPNLNKVSAYNYDSMNVYSTTLDQNVYPNPFDDEFKFEINNAEKIKELLLINSSREIIKVEYECADKNLCNVKAANLPTGIYYLEVRTKKRDRIFKIIKR